MCAQMNFPGFDGSTSSQESADGQRRSASPGGQQTSPSGPAAPHASLSASPGKDSAETIPGTSPPTLRGWSGLGAPWCCLANRSPAQRFSARFQDRLAERLQARLHGRGAMIYRIGWKRRVTPMGRQICALRASAPRISDSVSFLALFAGKLCRGSLSGWPTTTATDGLKQGAVSPRPGMMGLSETVPLAGWATASARDWKDSAGMATEGVNPDGSTRSRTDQLPRQAQLAGWTTPSASDDRRGGEITEAMTGSSLVQMAAVAGWPTPTVGNATGSQMAKGASATGRRPDGTKATVSLPQVANLASGTTGAARFTVSGQMLTGCSAGMNGGGQLNPELPRWLMGYRAVWGFCGDMAMRSIRGSRQRSSKPSPDQSST